MDKDLLALSRLFKALADPTRVRILGLLLGGEVCVCNIHDSLRIPQPKASRHLAYLRRAGLVHAEKRGLWVYYRLADRRDGLVQMLRDAVHHSAAHLATVKRDAVRLQERTGCCAPALTPAAGCACCEAGQESAES